jgi:hypothetical protein
MPVSDHLNGLNYYMKYYMDRSRWIDHVSAVLAFRPHGPAVAGVLDGAAVWALR